MEFRFFEGEKAGGVQVFNQTVDVWIKPREGEVERRSALGVGAITDYDIVRALMGLPEGLPVDVGSLDASAIFAMDDMLDIGAVEIVDGSVYRLAIPPVELVGFTKVARQWSDVQEATLLCTHGPRYVVASRAIARRTLREIDPEVGVAICEGQECRILRRPGTAAVCPSWQRWAIAEEAFARWLGSLNQEPVPRPQ